VVPGAEFGEEAPGGGSDVGALGVEFGEGGLAAGAVVVMAVGDGAAVAVDGVVVAVGVAAAVVGVAAVAEGVVAVAEDELVVL